MSKHPDPDSLLHSIVEIMERDIELILQHPEDKLSPRDAAKLTRYSSALLDIQTYVAEKEKVAKRKLANLSDEELNRLAREALKK